MKTNIFLKSLLVISISITSLYAADDKLLEHAWLNIGYSNAKDTMLSGATTATGKGYSALFTNPAGLSTNYAAGIYILAHQLEHKNATGSTDEKAALAKTSEVKAGDNPTVGIFYKYLVLEVRKNVHDALGLAYGLETNYGLFSLGANYVKDITLAKDKSEDRTIKDYRDFGTGDYYTLGFQYQKSFIGINNFYAVYFGFSKKGQGVKQFEEQQIYRISPIITKVGIGFETNIMKSTILLSLDQTNQSWNDIDDTLDTTAIGLKWMVFSGFTTALGYSKSTYTTDVDLDTSSTISGGVEFGFWNANIAIAVLQKEILNGAGDVYIQENSFHADLSIAF